MGAYNTNPNEVPSKPKITSVERAAANLPQSTATSIFTIATGPIILVKIFGEVTTVVEAGVNNTKFIHNPTTGADVDLCTTTSIGAAPLAAIFNITGTLTAALATNQSTVVTQKDWIDLQVGTIDFSCDASKTGQVKFTLHYISLGGVVTAA